MLANRMHGRVLIVAGSDSGGGAGIQADIKTVTALQGYAATAVTAVTVQNTLCVTGVHAIPVDVITAQMVSVLNDIGTDAVKTGMLANASVVAAVCDALTSYAGHVPIVVDPVMVAKGGASLLQPDAMDALRRKLLPLAKLATPNIPEAEAILGRKIIDSSQMHTAARELLNFGSKSALVKGGHLEGDLIVDVYAGPEGTHEWRSKRISTRHTHGTGCTLASAIATGFAQGLGAIDSITRARNYVLRAIETAPNLGQGHGPLNHAHTVNKFEEIR